MQTTELLTYKVPQSMDDLKKYHEEQRLVQTNVEDIINSIILNVKTIPDFIGSSTYVGQVKAFRSIITRLYKDYDFKFISINKEFFDIMYSHLIKE